MEKHNYWNNNHAKQKNFFLNFELIFISKQKIK